MRFRLIALAGALLFLAGCGHTQTGTPSVSVSDDQFSKIVTIEGQRQLINPLGGTGRLWFLRSFVDKTNLSVVHQLFVKLDYDAPKKVFGDFANFDIAGDEDANELDVVRIKRQTSRCTDYSCMNTEIFGVSLPDSQLRKKNQVGYSIKVSAKRTADAYVLTVSPQQIQLQLDAIAAIQEKYKKK